MGAYSGMEARLVHSLGRSRDRRAPALHRGIGYIAPAFRLNGVVIGQLPGSGKNVTVLSGPIVGERFKKGQFKEGRHSLVFVTNAYYRNSP